MRINHNIAALNTYRQMSTNSTASGKSIEKLSSGLRINRAGDDAAGLAISEKMRAQIRGLDQAQRNSQDGISMIQTTEGALNESHSILQRMRELAAQAANDTNVSVDREEIQKEINQLTSEINRIGNTTEFNTQSLLKGKNVPVVESAATVNTVTAGEAGVPVGDLSDLVVNTKSVVGKTSTATVQASTSKATGTAGGVTETATSVKGEKSFVTVANGITFEADALGDDLNGKTITIKAGEGNNVTSGLSIDGSGNYTFTIGTNGTGASLATNRGTLYNELKAAIDGAAFGAGQEISVQVPGDTAEVVTSVDTVGTLSGGKDEALGAYNFTITDRFEEAGDTITVGGKTFTAVLGTADAAKGQFSIGTDANNLNTAIQQATSLVAALQANTSLNDHYTIDNTAGASATITFAEKANQGTGVALADPVVKGSGQDDKLVISNSAGQNLNKVTLTEAATVGATQATQAIGADGQTATITAVTGGSRANQVTINMVQNTGNDTLNVSYKDGVLTVSLADTTAGNNNVANIQTQIQALGTKDGIDFSGWTVTDGGGWDNAVTGAVIGDAGGQMAGGADATTANQLNVTATGADLTIHLSGDKASENTAEKIQEAVRALGEVFYKDASGAWDSIDYSKFTFEAQGEWDTNTLGNSIIVGEGTFVGGTEEVKGEYQLEIDKAFVAGDKVEINGKVFTAVESGAVASKGEFNVTGGNINSQAAGLIDAINLSSLKDTYTATANGGVITLTEKAATGKDLAAKDIEVRATGTQGEYTTKLDEVLTSGSKFIVDGEEILITNKNQHVGYDNGTAVKVSETLADQNKALADAINNNAKLKDKYVASVGEDGSLKLTQTEDYTTDKAPEISTKNSSEGDFQATFQIGANSGQSMTITVGDMRSEALGISGDGSVGTVKANNGSVASYTAVANVNSGSDNKNVEFALDVTTSEKASAALSVINDAIEKVSAQRSQLGAFQNRLEHTINNLGTSSENLVASESRIRDVDMAKEMMEFTKNNILSQAAQAMLAQANQQPQGVLQLLR